MKIFRPKRNFELRGRPQMNAAGGMTIGEITTVGIFKTQSMNNVYFRYANCSCHKVSQIN